MKQHQGAFKRIVTLDLESRSEVDLRKVGTHVYANHPSTQIICCSLAVDNGPVELWTEDDFITLPAFLAPYLNEGTLWCFHNAAMEHDMLHYQLGIDLPLEQVLDSAAVARHANLPGKLEELAKFFGLAKDMSGNSVMLKLARPRKASKDNKDRFWTSITKPDDFKTLYEYNMMDVRVQRACLTMLPPISPSEMKVFRATMRANMRGIPVDATSARMLSKIAKQSKADLSRGIKDKYGFTLGQVNLIAPFLGLPNVAKATIRDFLKDPSLSPAHHEVALARQTFAKSSTNKIDTLLVLAQTDGRIHDGLVYGGAERTLRFSGKGFQAQNLVRGLGKKQDAAFDALHSDGFEWAYPNILETISGMIRGLLTDARGVWFFDLAQIEARLLCWYADDQKTLDIFRAGGDPYRILAALIYGKLVEDITPDERFMGKQARLAAGYGLGGKGFQRLLDVTYDVQVSEDEAKAVVKGFRDNSPEIVLFWRRIDQAMDRAFEAMGKRVKIPPIEIKIDLTICFTDETNFNVRLPSGRKLNFYNVRKDDNGNWSCFSRLRDGGGYGERKLYAGLICGVIVQSTARDLIALSITQLDEAGFDFILTVHDENVVLGEEDPARFEEFKRIATTKPAWLTNFPLGADIVQSTRYRK